MGKKTVVPVTIAMSIDLARRLRVLAAKQNKSRSRFVREVLERAMASHASTSDAECGQGTSLVANTPASTGGTHDHREVEE